MSSWEPTFLDDRQDRDDRDDDAEDQVEADEELVHRAVLKQMRTDAGSRTDPHRSGITDRWRP